MFLELDQSIPIVPWTREQQNILNNPSFILLLHKLGFHLPVDTMKLFVRVPHFWTADYIYGITQKLGPIDPGTDYRQIYYFFFLLSSFDINNFITLMIII